MKTMKTRLKTKINYIMGLALVVGALLLTGCASRATGTSSISTNGEKIAMTMYMSQSCGCCAGYSTEMENNGFDVEVIPTNDLELVKDERNIPSNMRSCHTSIIEGYVLEGHVPKEAVMKLLAEKPDVDGLAVPGMPSGVGGMPGPKRGEVIVYSVSDGVPTEYMRT